MPFSQETKQSLCLQSRKHVHLFTEPGRSNCDGGKKKLLSLTNGENFSTLTSCKENEAMLYPDVPFCRNLIEPAFLFKDTRLFPAFKGYVFGVIP